MTEHASTSHSTAAEPHWRTTWGDTSYVVEGILSIVDLLTKGGKMVRRT